MENVVKVNCYKCHVDILFSKEVHANLLKTGEIFHCTNGHSQHFTESTVSVLEKKVKRLEERNDNLSNLSSDRYAEIEHLNRRINGYKGYVKKLQNQLILG